MKEVCECLESIPERLRKMSTENIIGITLLIICTLLILFRPQISKCIRKLRGIDTDTDTYTDTDTDTDTDTNFHIFSFLLGKSLII